MCYRPINVKQADGRFQKVKCGKCLECLNEKRNAWVIRMEEELKSAHGKGVFFTLTYSDDNIPKNFLVYETSFTDVPKLYESYSDYNYATPVGFRGKKSVSEPVDKVLQEFYKDYTITDFNIDNNYKKYKEYYEEIEDLNQLIAQGDDENDALVSEGFPCDFSSLYDYTEPDFTDTPYCSIDPDSSDCESRVSKYNRIGDEFYYDNRFEEDPIEERYSTSQDIQPLDQGAVDRLYCGKGDDTELPDTMGDTEDGLRKPYLVLSFNSVRQKDVQDWLKRGREKVKRKGLNFTYFITSEYGPRTLRPHYHGCFFGVSLDDVRFMFDDWRVRFGRRIKADNIKGTGGISYCAKYCAKGFYEHPLCSRDFFYIKKHVDTGSATLDELLNRLEFSEYHSKHYERCLEFFHLDKPIVVPSFRLVSKGLGEGYISRTKDYFRLDEAEQEISILKHSNDYDEYFTRTMEDIKRYFHYTSQKGFTSIMPQYYSKKMFSDNLRHAFANYVRSQYDKLYFAKFTELQAADPSREDAEIISQLEEEQRRTKIISLQRKVDKIQRYYNKSKL